MGRFTRIFDVFSLRPESGVRETHEVDHYNSEFLAALEDYRKGDIGDCLTKCGERESKTNDTVSPCANRC